MDDIINVISTVGFPIFACIYMAKFMRTDVQELIKVVDKMSDAIDRLNERLDRLEAKFNEK